MSIVIKIKLIVLYIREVTIAVHRWSEYPPSCMHACIHTKFVLGTPISCITLYNTHNEDIVILAVYQIMVYCLYVCAVFDISIVNLPLLIL